ncbi:MAG TPA: hypothetical protein DD640_03185 [Clostridiales bacterium]|nr:hypothetical protein [Clostridiales bacterium]
MSRAYYIRDESPGSPLLRRLLIIVLSLALAGGIGTGLYLYRSSLQSARNLQDFQEALQAGEYAAAVGVFRQTQEKALAAGPFDRNQAQYQDVLALMETQIGQRLDAMEEQLRQGQTLSGDDLSFAETMAELTAVRLATYLRGLCADYLCGAVKRPVVEKAFAQLAQLDNLAPAIGGLPDQFDRIEAAQPQFRAAIADLEIAEYWSCYQTLQNLLNDSTMAGFVQEQAQLMADECAAAMYQPLLEQARLLMAGGRYLTAQDALQELAVVFPEDPDLLADLAECRTRVPEQLAPYSGIIEVITVKPLIVRPEKAFDGDSYAGAANDSMLTVGEFNAMLEQLYANQYILIDSSRIYTEDRRLNELQLPPGKKPLVLVLEGLNYYATRRETGNCWNLVLDEGGEVSAEYPDASGNMIVDRGGEAIGILDEFVAAHPDFSLDGAKGTISLTGYECVFGYVTDQDQLDDRNQALQDNGMAAVSLTGDDITANRQQAQEIIDRLKMTGWLFASSTYGFIDARNQTMERIQADTQKWLDQVGKLTGPVGFLNYPNGSFLTGSDERAIWLKEQGFILFGGLGTTAYLYAGEDYIYVDKTPINGFTLRNAASYQLSRLFDAGLVYDRNVRPR